MKDVRILAIRVMSALLPFRAVFFAAFAFIICLGLAACAVPNWLSDVETAIPILSSAAASILSLIGALVPGASIAATVASAISAWATRIDNGLANINTLVAAYHNDPDNTPIQNIEAAINEVVADIPTFSQIEGIPAALTAKLEAAGQMIATQLTSIGTLIPVLKVNASLAPEAEVAGTKLTIQVPLSAKAFKKQWNDMLVTPTGDPVLDAAFHKARKL